MDKYYFLLETHLTKLEREVDKLALLLAEEVAHHIRVSIAADEQRDLPVN